jgi:hypothetical protein
VRSTVERTLPPYLVGLSVVAPIAPIQGWVSLNPMKRASWIAAFALLSVGALAEHAVSGLRGVDDPPPEPVTCPLCAGDPALHARRVFGIAETASFAAGLTVRW